MTFHTEVFSFTFDHVIGDSVKINFHDRFRLRTRGKKSLVAWQNAKLAFYCEFASQISHGLLQKCLA